MTDTPQERTPALPDIGRIAERWAETSQKSLALMNRFAEQAMTPAIGTAEIDQSALRAFQDLALKLSTNPMAVAEAQVDLWKGMMDVWTDTAARMAGVEPGGGKAGKPDRRFAGEEWEETVAFDYIKQSYLVASDYIQNLVGAAEDDLDPAAARKVKFLSRQFVSAISPANFIATNPAVLKETVNSGGENLLAGLNNLLGDLERGEGQLKISMTDEKAFEVGKNVASTPGKVVFRNRLFELIMYEPSTDKVHATPMLFVPPWINKYYVLDLKPENSLIKWVVDQGHTLFVISWVNPDDSLKDVSFADYMREGVLVALDEVERICAQPRINLLGFCIGGILSTTTLAWMAAKGDDRINAVTLLATMIDLKDVGEMSVFVDAEQIRGIEKKVSSRGYLEGREMAEMFNMMRENDLIWSFVVQNYLMGKEPVPFDLLYWNSDSTRMPAKMIVEYLSKFYRDNAFIEGGLEIDGVGIDVTKIKTPAYLLATKEDHIAPWKSCFEGKRAFAGPTRFVLGGSGHIAGIANPPVKNKYAHWINEEAQGLDPDTWFAGATQHPGSWWTDWGKWLKAHGGKKVPARSAESCGAEILCDAPGEYVKVRAK